MIFKLKYFLFFQTFISLTKCDQDWSADQHPDKWNKYSKEKIDRILNKKLNNNVAKNVILFLGDGMGVTTVTAGRIRKGQLKNKNGEEEITHMENLDYVALSKTYNINAQTPDSAGTATAFLTGVKTRIGSIGVDGRAYDCPSSLNSKLNSILKWAHYSGKSVGIVTNTRVTHATPAAAYANSFNREMEAYDGKNFLESHFKQGCRDIAAQLIDENSFIKVVFGGGRKKFLRVQDHDIYENRTGDRIDGRNLINEWTQNMKNKNLRYKFLWNYNQFKELNPNEYDQLLGLFNWEHMEYEVDRVKKNPIIEPSIIEMTEKAIQILSKNINGFFLLVEGGKIDHGHHNNLARKALDDFVVFDEAVGKAKEMLSLDESLIVVSADHSHVFTLGGYAVRGNPILGVVITNETDKLTLFNETFTSLLYANGPSYKLRKENLTNTITESPDYTQEVAVPLPSETHGGEDVTIFASGPMAHLFEGTLEQSHIAHVMAYSACIGPYNTIECKKNRHVLTSMNSAQSLAFSYKIINFFSIFILFSFFLF